MTKQEEIMKGIRPFFCGTCEPADRGCRIYNGRCTMVDDIIPKLLTYLNSKGVVIKVKCPDCAWSQFKDGEHVGMTLCCRCNSTGYIFEPLTEE